MPSIKKGHIKSLIGVSVLSVYIGLSIFNQIKYIYVPFTKHIKYLTFMLAKDDIEQLKELSYPIYQVVDKINSYPEHTEFYFVPCFEDSGNSGIWWWYLYLLSRYMCYPRKIFCHDEILYSGNKTGYIRNFIGDGKRYSELEWINARGIKYIILLRNNTFSILSIETEIKI